MKNIKILGLIVLISIMINQSCEISKTALPHSIGKTLELVVVTDNKGQWKGMMGDTIREYFGQMYVGLPQWEPMFDIFYLPQEAFGDMYKPNHLIFIVDIDSKAKEPVVETRKNLWAAPQRVVKITAPDQESFFKIFNERKEGIMQLYQELSRERILNFFKTAEAKNAKETLKRFFKADMALPSGFKVAKRVEDNFIWIRKETNTFSQGLFIYTFDYTNTDAFELDRITGRRDLLTKIHVPGPVDDSYMKVADEVIKPIVEEVNYNGMYAVETRGLWDVENDFMGGPFMSYTFVNEKTNKVITIDAYVYAPKDNKRIHMKEMEAILHSFEFITEE